MTRQHGWWAPYLFIAPFVLLFAVFTIYPLCYSVVLAFQQTQGPRIAVFVGFDNFTFLFEDPLFWKAVRNTFLFAAGSMFLQLPCSLGLAMLMNRPDLKGRSFFRLIFFSPSLVGLVFVGVIFALIFEERTGLLNVLLFEATRDIAAWLHLPRGFIFDPDFPWLQEYAMPALILAALWMYTGFNMIYFLAALQNVRRELIEAAMMDGANAWDRFIHIVIPAIRPVAVFVLLLSLIGSFQLFELPFLLLGGGGVDNQGLTIVMYLYQTGFITNDLGLASAIGWLLATLLAFFALVNFFIIKRGEA